MSFDLRTGIFDGETADRQSQSSPVRAEPERIGGNAVLDLEGQHELAIRRGTRGSSISFV